MWEDWRDKLDEREKHEVDFSTIYDHGFNHGTSGHLAYKLIAKMSRLLDRFSGKDAKPMEKTDEQWAEKAKGAYMAYGAVTDFKNFQGNPMPAWENLPDTIQKAWAASVQWVYKDLAVSVIDE